MLSLGSQAERTAAIRLQMKVEMASLDDMYGGLDSGEHSIEARFFKTEIFDWVKRKVFHNPLEGGGGHSPRGEPKDDEERYSSK